MNIQPYVNKFVDDLPKKRKIINIDLILDGGTFNGSYLIGAMYYLRELENRKYINIERISASSIGSFIALAYMGDCLDLFAEKLYYNTRKHFKSKHNLNAFTSTFQEILPRLPENLHIKMNNRVFITYYNIQKGEKIIKSQYKSIKDVFETIRKSCSIPFMIDGNFAYKDKYIDGFNPYIFPPSKKKILFIDLYGYDKFRYALDIKNEKNNHHRIFNGLVDIHTFFLKGYSTSMCSYVNDWFIANYIHYGLKYIIEMIICNILILGRPIIVSYYGNIILKRITHISRLLLREFCV